MRVLGIDPGIADFAWCIYDSNKNEFTHWGYDKCFDGCEGVRKAYLDDMQVCIEDVQSYGNMIGKHVLSTAKTVGWLQAKIPHAVLLHRKTIVAAITGSARSGDKEVNLAIGRLVPSFAAKRMGLNGHHRSAAAVAYVGVGRVNAP